MTKLAKFILAAAFAVSVAGAAQAQRQPGGQGGRGGMGFQQPLHILLLSNADLQKELKITDDQKKGLKDVMDKAEALNKKMQEAFGGGGGREAFQAIQEERTKLAEEAKAAAEKALTEDQKKRVKQIEVQRMGMMAFANDDVVKALKVTDDQKAKLKSIGEEVQKEIGDLRREYGGGGGGRPDPEKMAEMAKKTKAITDEAMEKVTKELSDDQKKAWKELTGEPFDVSKLNPQMRRRDN
jgi:Spy/CpxP family protein refolding chaperone